MPLREKDYLYAFVHAYSLPLDVIFYSKQDKDFERFDMVNDS
jgi:hypothetical protein